MLPKLFPRAISFFALVVVLSSLLACGQSSSAEPTLPCPIPPGYTGEAEVTPVAITLSNETCSPICGVWVSHKDCDDWGVDWLDQDMGVIPSGRSFTINLPPAVYDLNIQDCLEYETFWYQTDLTMDNQLTFTSNDIPNAASCPATLTVSNQAEVPICHLWITTDAAAHSWGLDWLGTNQINPGTAQTFPIPSGTYDLKAEDCDFIPLATEFQLSITMPLVWLIPSP
ncbi:MAG: hypothetical protein JW726_01485 [Anaerolineales bacterium]|nr:hypothetical protein [Anaerolineales bacterium]